MSLVTRGLGLLSLVTRGLGPAGQGAPPPPDGGGTQPVSFRIAARYAIHQRVAIRRTGRYAIHQITSFARTARYAIHQAVTFRRTARYAIHQLAAVTFRRTARYAIHQRAAFRITGRYAIIQRPVRRITARYPIHQRVAFPRTGRYDITVNMPVQGSTYNAAGIAVTSTTLDGVPTTYVWALSPQQGNVLAIRIHRVNADLTLTRIGGYVKRLEPGVNITPMGLARDSFHLYVLAREGTFGPEIIFRLQVNHDGSLTNPNEFFFPNDPNPPLQRVFTTFNPSANAGGLYITDNTAYAISFDRIEGSDGTTRLLTEPRTGVNQATSLTVFQNQFVVGGQGGLDAIPLTGPATSTPLFPISGLDHVTGLAYDDDHSRFWIAGQFRGGIGIYSVEYREAVAFARTGRYPIHQAVTFTRTGRYAIGAFMSAAFRRTGRYAIHQRAAFRRTARYSIRQAVSLTRTARYNIRQAAAFIRVGRYPIHQAVTFTRAGRYAIRALAAVAFTRVARYAIHQRTAFTRTARYSIHQRVAFRRTGRYAIRALAAVAIRRVGRYAIHQRVAIRRTARYAILQRAAFRRAGRYSIRQAVTTARVGRYAIHQAVTFTRAGRYNIQGLMRVAFRRVARYAIHQRVAIRRAARYDILQQAVRRITGRYTIHGVEPVEIINLGLSSPNRADGLAVSEDYIFVSLTNEIRTYDRHTFALLHTADHSTANPGIRFTGLSYDNGILYAVNDFALRLYRIIVLPDGSLGTISSVNSIRLTTFDDNGIVVRGNDLTTIGNSGSSVFIISPDSVSQQHVLVRRLDPWYRESLTKVGQWLLTTRRPFFNPANHTDIVRIHEFIASIPSSDIVEQVLIRDLPHGSSFFTSIVGLDYIEGNFYYVTRRPGVVSRISYDLDATPPYPSRVRFGRTGRYSILQQAVARITGSYPIHQLATFVRAGRYNIQGLMRVVSTRVGRYAIHQPALRRIAARYAIHQRVAIRRAARYPIHQITSFARTARYNIRQAAARRITGLYRIIGVVLPIRIGRHDTFITQTRDADELILKTDGLDEFVV